MAEPVRIIRGLIPGSETERAGLRNGDEIVHPVGLDGIQGNQKGMRTLQIRRDGKVFPVSYLPRGEAVEVPQWQRVRRVPDSECRNSYVPASAHKDAGGTGGAGRFRRLATRHSQFPVLPVGAS